MASRSSPSSGRRSTSVARQRRRPEPLDPQLGVAEEPRAVVVEGDATLVEDDRRLQRQAARLEPADHAAQLVERGVEGHRAHVLRGRPRPGGGAGERLIVTCRSLARLHADVQRAARQAHLERVAGRVVRGVPDDAPSGGRTMA